MKFIDVLGNFGGDILEKFDSAFQRVVETQRRLDDLWFRRLVGARVRAIRIGRKLDQAVAAESAGIHASKLCKIENGVQRMTPEDAIALGKALGVAVDAFLVEEPEHAAV